MEIVLNLGGKLQYPFMLYYNYICNNFTPRIKGIWRVTYLMSPWFEGNIFDVALVRGQHCDVTLYKGFVEGSIFIIKVGGFDRGFYLSQQLKELICSKG